MILSNMVRPMKLIVAIILIIALTSANGISQQLLSTKIIGRVIDTTETGVPYATIQFLGMNDSLTRYGCKLPEKPNCLKVE